VFSVSELESGNDFRLFTGVTGIGESTCDIFSRLLLVLNIVEFDPSDKKVSSVSPSISAALHELIGGGVVPLPIVLVTDQIR
jgi:hypothetical protein